MSFSSVFPLVNLRKTLQYSINLVITKCNYAKQSAPVSTIPKKKKLGKLGPMMEKKILPVETDTTKLVNFVCGSNILKTGENIKIRPDCEYPEWLWTLRTGPAPPLEELDPESKQYWRRIKKLAMRRNNKLAKLKKF